MEDGHRRGGLRIDVSLLLAPGGGRAPALAASVATVGQDGSGFRGRSKEARGRTGGRTVCRIVKDRRGCICVHLRDQERQVVDWL